MPKHFGKAEVLEQCDNICKCFVKCQHIRIARLDKALMHTIQKCMRRFMCNDVVQQLSEYLDDIARGQLQELAKQRELTPEQLAKLNVAARIQVARDCRTVQELVSSSVKAIRDNPFLGVQQMRNDELGLMRNCAQLSDLFEDGIARNDSLFTKVLNHLK